MTNETSQPTNVGSNDQLGVLLEGCTVTAYDAGQDVRIEAAKQMDGSTKWAIRSRGSVMGITGEWEWEPLPSSRDDEFMMRCRFSTPAEALACLQRAHRNA